MMTWDEVMALFGSKDYTGIRTSFPVMRGLLALLGSPEKKLHFIHVAGTNGKGSASRMMQAVLTAAGCHTGLYISPHLEYMNERWSIDGAMIPDEDITRIAHTVKSAINKWNHEEVIQPTAFELLTMVAFIWFQEKHCDIVVLEVGIGGLVDATNVIPAPECALIMNIGLEHTELLGDTLEKIAMQKGGIIKENGDVILYHQSDSVEEVIRTTCREKNAHLSITEPDLLCLASPSSHCYEFSSFHSADQSGSWFSYKSHRDIHLNLSGSYQRYNALVVLDAIDVLRRKNWNIPESAVHSALDSVTWPGRFEIVSRDPLVIVDGAHNPNGIGALIDAIREEKHTIEKQKDGSFSKPYPKEQKSAFSTMRIHQGILAGKELTFVIGIMADKDVDTMLRLLAPLASRFIMEAPDNERADSPEDLKSRVSSSFQGEVLTAPSIGRALDLAISAASPDCAIICCGSLFQVAAIRKYFGVG